MTSTGMGDRLWMGEPPW